MDLQRGNMSGSPAARFEKLVVTETADEVLLYDTEKHHIHHLNATTAAVWRLCDGERDVAAISRDAGRALSAEVDVATVRLALTRLDDAGLLRESLIDELRVSRMSRRTFMQRAGVAGAIAVPVIVSTTVPAAAAHVSGMCEHSCNNDNQCATPGVNPCPVCNNGTCRSDQCGRSCSNSNQCQAPTGACTQCLNGTCQSAPGLRAAGSQTRAAEPTAAPTEAPAEIPVDVSTEVPTEEPTEAATEIPTEEPTEVVTETPVTPEPTVVPTEETIVPEGDASSEGQG